MKNKRIILTSILSFFFLASCSTDSSIGGSEQWEKSTKRNILWVPVWIDEFNGTTLERTQWLKLSQETSDIKSDWGRYMSDDPSLYTVKDGVLKLHGKVNTGEEASHLPYVTGGVVTGSLHGDINKTTFAFNKGKIEIRAKFDSANRAWPALWLLPMDNKWPSTGEIDLMEHLNYDSFVYQTLHTDYTYTFGYGNRPPKGTTAYINRNEYNVYGLEWYDDELRFLLNGRVTHIYPRLPLDQLPHISGYTKEEVADMQWPFDKQRFFILMTMQIGGGWVDSLAGSVQPGEYPISMDIDWVRVYQAYNTTE